MKKDKRKETLTRKVEQFMEEYLPEMQDLLSKSREEGVEYGFLICESKKKMFPGKPCRGNFCGVVVSDCSVGKAVGVYHTHVYSSPAPSLGDVLSLIQRDKKIACIGSLETNEICCYYLKETGELVNEEELTGLELLAKAPPETYETIKCIVAPLESRKEKEK